ncbi:peptidoglycan DD-metalloendopeptidase family protein [Candidatus Oscillochloris fontis]|uniref:peptidoglycan DD-metalloendopeptidase family protein n=1 Tax=Candidatus Oscillochloris fontis TaxID=2496868 RepID=UPI00101B7786|nr:peptidoglycan DD-metalloendopeptidase family protein [Candidatus Oscillochloris fontis]
MSALRTLRMNRAISLFDLARLADLPARRLAEAEYGVRPLAWEECEQLALILGIRPNELAPPIPANQVLHWPQPMSQAAPALFTLTLVATLASAALQGELPHIHRRLPIQPVRAAQILASLSPRSGQQAAQFAVAGPQAAPETPSPALLLRPTPPEPVPPAFWLSAEGPRGCPLQPSSGTVVITQEYGVGSHAPTEVLGAVDLAVDGDGDGYAEPGATWYTPVVATHAGVVEVDLESYPAGNHVWVRDGASGWQTGYSHLAIVTVISGQQVRPGEVIGMVGSSGVSSGPHLDYQVWRGEQNVDPTGLVER